MIATPSGEANAPRNHADRDDFRLEFCTGPREATSPDQTQTERLLISDPNPHDSVYSSPIKDPKSVITCRTRGLRWAYSTRTEADATLLHAGVWLWNLPRTYLQPPQILANDQPHDSNATPVFISHESTGDMQPIIKSDGSRLHIVPHTIPWPDIRSIPGHPDFLVPRKLVEYQASEAAGYHISRHNRSFLYCRKTGCGAEVVDTNPSVYICYGCGPKTVIRYCSFKHQVEDIEEHWKECGHPDLVMKFVFDHGVERLHQCRDFPAIKEKHWVKSFARHRQQVYSRHYKGHYTLFNSASLNARTLSWSKSDPKSKEMDNRVERLLNIAFFDANNRHVVSYLYRLLRQLLITAEEWNVSTQSAFNSQFNIEFGDGLFDPLSFGDRPPCECEWTGLQSAPWSHCSECIGRLATDFGPQAPILGLKVYVERVENRYWILSASRLQHPIEGSWQWRAAGYGFSESPAGFKRISLGPGWTGWGGMQDNICLPDSRIQ